MLIVWAVYIGVFSIVGVFVIELVVLILLEWASFGHSLLDVFLVNLATTILGLFWAMSGGKLLSWQILPGNPSLVIWAPLLSCGRCLWSWRAFCYT
jgi:hypothetical protein